MRPPSNPSGTAPRLTRPEWWLLALLLVCYTYFFPRYADWNQNSRLDLILAIVDEGRLEIDTYAHNTGDYAEFNGHRYSDKAPGPALLGVPVYIATRWALTAPLVDPLIDRLAQSSALRGTLRDGEAPRDKVEFALAQMALTWVVVALPSVLLGIALYRLLGEIVASVPARLLLTTSYALATSAFPYSGNFYSHQLSAAMLFVSFALLWRGRAAGPARLWLVGMMLGLALISEYSTALIVGALVAYAAYFRVRLIPLLAGITPPLAVMAVHNYAIFRSPLPVGYAHSALWQAEHSTGFFSLTYPRLDALWGITFSPFRGLFFVSPILLLSAIGFVVWARERRFRSELLVCGWSVVSFFAFNSASAMWSGGFGVGPRYLVPMLPFMVLPLAFAWKRWGERRLFRRFFALLLAWSLVVVWAESIATQSFPTYDPMPLWNLSLPALLAGDVARSWGTLLGLHGLASLLPLVTIVLLILGRLGASVRRPSTAVERASLSPAPVRS